MNDENAVITSWLERDQQTLKHQPDLCVSSSTVLSGENKILKSG